MNQTLEQLIKLQGIDQRLLEIKEHMGDLPGTVESQESGIVSLKEENQKQQEKLNEVLGKIHFVFSLIKENVQLQEKRF